MIKDLLSQGFRMDILSKDINVLSINFTLCGNMCMETSDFNMQVHRVEVKKNVSLQSLVILEALKYHLELSTKNNQGMQSQVASRKHQAHFPQNKYSCFVKKKSIRRDS